MRYKITEAALHRIGSLWVSIMKRKIREANKIASGFLLESIGYEVKIGPDGDPVLEIQYADYWKYVNDGRKPRKKERPITAENGAVPIPALLEWIKIKGIRARDKKGRFTSVSRLSLAFSIRASIWKYGIKPANLFDRTIVDLEDMLNPINIPAGTPPALKQELERIFISTAEDINTIIENLITKELQR
jgi:hypothetical protein